MLSGRISEDPRPARAQFFRALKSKPAVVMLGDSLTHQGDWAELFGSSRVVNRGISGDTTDGILGRIDEVTSREPRLVVMLIGVNDLRNKSPEYVANNVYMILSKLRSTGINVLIQGQFHISNQSVNAKIDRYNAIISRFCRDNGISYIDLNVALLRDGILSSDKTYDGLHLKDTMYLEWAELLRPYVELALN